MSVKRWSIRLGLLAGLCACAIQSPGASATEIVVTRVAPHLWVLRGTYANMLASLGPDGVLLVDDDMQPLTEELLATLEHLGGGAPRFIVNTHWHGDHTGGNPFFAQRGATIVAHENVLARLSTTQVVLGESVPPAPESGWPQVTFADALSLHVNGEQVALVHHSSGHTDGDAVVHFRGANVVHMGDLYFEGYFPNVDLASGGDVEGYLACVEAVLGGLPEDTVVVPGHGPVGGVDDLRRFARMLRETIEHVRAGLDAGRSVDELVLAGVPAQWASLDSPFLTTERFVRTIHASLSRPR